MRLFLIGMPGSGKTYWAKRISLKFSCKVIDLDQEIERKFKTSIPNLFLNGEDFFREKENEILKQIIFRMKKDSLDYIVSTGGGTPCFPENLKLMKDCGKIIYLKEEISDLKERILKDTKERPILAKSELDLNQLLTALYLKRKDFYEQADFIIEPNKKSIIEFTKDLISTKTQQYV